MQEITYEIDGYCGSIYWAVSEFFVELSGRKFMLGEMEASQISKMNDLSEISKILLSAVAGAVIQHLLDSNLSTSDIFEKGIMEIQ